MFKKITHKLVSISTISALLFTSLFSFNSYAVDEKACSIWLCLPSGFPGGCSDAYSEFKKRIKKGKNPLPDLGSCLVDTGTPADHKITAYQGPEIQIIPHRECTKWAKSAKKNKYKDEYCQEWKDVPADLIKTSRCPLPTSPVNYSNFCVKRNMAEIYDDGKVVGTKFYY